MYKIGAQNTALWLKLFEYPSLVIADMINHVSKNSRVSPNYNFPYCSINVIFFLCVCVHSFYYYYFFAGESVCCFLKAFNFWHTDNPYALPSKLLCCVFDPSKQSLIAFSRFPGVMEMVGAIDLKSLKKPLCS